MSEPAHIQIVVFDIGGVLIRLARNWADASVLAGVSMYVDIDQPAIWPDLRSVFYNF